MDSFRKWLLDLAGRFQIAIAKALQVNPPKQQNK